MDRNSLIGVGLIGAILIGWLYFSAPSKEEVARKQFVQDSIAQVQVKQAEKEAQAIALEKKKADSLKVNDTTQIAVANLSDSAKLVLEEKKLVENFRDFAPAAKGKEEFIVLENNLIKVKLSTKGGKIASVELKNYTRPNSKEPWFCFKMIV
jgi:YidC/Oxa1 family membrane protein insertase